MMNLEELRDKQKYWERELRKAKEFRAKAYKKGIKNTRGVYPLVMYWNTDIKKIKVSLTYINRRIVAVKEEIFAQALDGK